MELEFTDCYRAHEQEPVPLRELACLKVQYPAILRPVREGDLLAGIVEWGAVGFSPKDDEEFAYYMRPGAMEEKCRCAHKEERERLEEAFRFWQSRRLKTVTRARYDAETAAVLPSDELDDIYPAYPLYRMTGCIVDYRRLLKRGLPGLLEEVCACQKSGASREQEAFWEAEKGAVELLRDCCGFYALDCQKQAAQKHRLGQGQRARELEGMAENLEVLRDGPPKTFWQAAQLAWLYSVIAHTLDYGRMDDYLGTYLQRDLAQGVVTEAFAQRIVDNLWLLIADKKSTVHGRVVIGGLGRTDERAGDLFARFAMRATQHVRRIEPQLSLRCHGKMSGEVFGQAMDLLGAGTTYPILYNDDELIPAVQKAFHVSRQDACQYYPFGCGEYVIAGKSFGSPNGVINLAWLLELTLWGGRDPDSGRQIGLETGESFADFEAFYGAFLRQFTHYAHFLANQQKSEYDTAGEVASFLFLSLLYDDCLKRGKGMFQGGIRDLGGTLECYGNITASDSLYTLQILVFEKKIFTLGKMKGMLAADFAGYERERRQILALDKFGNDLEGPDKMAARLHRDICRIVAAQAKEAGLSTYLPVLINNDHNVRFGKATGATPDGRHAKAPLTNANSPTGGADKCGITALLSSMTALDRDNNAGTVQNVKLGKSMFTQNREKTKALIWGYFAKGGGQLMITVVSGDELRMAQKHPERYQNLFVRVGGYSGRFVGLPTDVQNDIIARTAYE